MNSIVKQYIVIGIMFFMCSNLFSQSVLQGQVANFPFDNILQDVSPSNISASNTGGVFTEDRFGIINNAIDLSGNNYVYFNDNSVKVNLPLTISAWVFVNSFSDLNIIFKSDNIYDNYHGYWLNIIAGNGRVGINFSGGTGGANSSNRRTFLTNTSLPLGQWVLVTAIIRTGLDMDIYFNCVPQPGTYSGTGSMSIAYSSTNSRIGSSVGDNALQSDRFYDGAIDDLIIWNRELTYEEITYYCNMANPCPEITVNYNVLNQVTCNGNNDGVAEVMANGGIDPYTYAWSPMGGNGSTASGLAAGTYSVLVTDSQGCTDSVEVFIDSPAPITIQETISSTECGANNGSVTINTSGGTGAYTYAWTPNVSSSSSANNLGSGLYSLVVSDENDCSESIDILIPTEGNLDVLIESLTNTSCIDVSDGTASVIVGGGFQPYIYAWSPMGGNGSTASGLAAGIYSILVTDSLGCTGSTEITISSPEQIEIYAEVIDANCAMNNGSISVTAIGGTGTLSFEWEPEGQTLNNISDLPAGNYTLTVTDDNGCFVSQEFIVGVIGNLDIYVDPVIATIDQGGSVQLTASGALYYNWDPSESLSCSDCIDPIASPTSTTTYAVNGTNSFGCTGIVYVTVYVNHLEADIFIPNVFTPNSDESNNYFSVKGFDNHKEFKVLILNRWGNAMFTSTDPNFAWNGQDQSGLEATEGVYFYVITGLSPFDGKPKEFHGFIHLVR